MKLTESQLRQVIREELKSLFSEGLYDDAMDGLARLTGGIIGKRDMAKRNARINAATNAKIAATKAAEEELRKKQSVKYERERKAKELADYRYSQAHPLTDEEKEENQRKHDLQQQRAHVADADAYEKWDKARKERERNTKTDAWGRSVYRPNWNS